MTVNLNGVDLPGGWADLAMSGGSLDIGDRVMVIADREHKGKYGTVLKSNLLCAYTIELEDGTIVRKWHQDNFVKI